MNESVSCFCCGPVHIRITEPWNDQVATPAFTNQQVNSILIFYTDYLRSDSTFAVYSFQKAHILGRIIDCVQVVLIAVLTAVSVVIGSMSLLFGQNNALRIASKLWSRSLFFILGIKIEINDPHPREFYEKRRYIFVSNHESHLDIPALFLSIPEAVFFIAKKELKKVPFMGWYMWAVGMIFIDRSDRHKAKQSMIKAGNKIKKGKNVLSFPEGTRTRTGKMGVFKRGTFILAVESGVPIVPISIRGAGECNPAGRFELHPGTIHVNIGQPIDSSAWTRAQIDEFAFYVRERVVELRNTETASSKPR